MMDEFKTKKYLIKLIAELIQKRDMEPNVEIKKTLGARLVQAKGIYYKLFGDSIKDHLPQQ